MKKTGGNTSQGKKRNGFCVSVQGVASAHLTTLCTTQKMVSDINNVYGGIQLHLFTEDKRKFP